MSKVTRRTFLSASALSLVAGRLSAEVKSEARATLDLSTDFAGPRMPEDFIGLSYEVEQFADPGFFAPANIGLIQEFKALSANGVLRLGGNTSEFGWWKPSPQSPEPEHPKTRIVEGEPRSEYYAVTPQAVQNLAGFLAAAGWSCIYGVGMGTNTPERAADEAEFAARTLGASLQYFQIGNEADLFARHLRDPRDWSVKTYLEQWLAIARAINSRVAGARFGLPDVASEIGWLAEIADRWTSVENPPQVTTLTHHYYFGGPATNPDVNIANLLKPATMARVQEAADVSAAAAKKMRARVRMTEGNTCYRGGKPGVSDVFASALWSADYALLLASNGYSGINLHGGTGRSVAKSVGGFLPGDVMLAQQGKTPAQIATHPHPFYTPIASFGADYVLQPVAYGMKFAGELAGGRLVNLTLQLQKAGVNATGYAAKFAGGKTVVIILNKDAERDLRVNLRFGGPRSSIVKIKTLSAPALDSREANITASGTPGRIQNGEYSLTVPRATGGCVSAE
jgi:hypothetical protein